MGLETVVGMATRPDADAEHLSAATPMREQRIIGPGGEEEVHHSVWCTALGHSVGVGTCRSCVRCERVTFDPAGRRSEVVCAMSPLPGPADGDGDALRMRASVSELMTRRVICVRTALPVRAVLMVLVEHGISGAPVVDAAGRPVGMVSITDLLREQYDQIEDEEDELLPYFAREAVDRNRAGLRSGAPSHLTAEDIMTPSVFSVREEALVADAAVEMARRGVHRVPVISRDGAVVGMVSALDVMRWMAAGLSRQPGAGTGEAP